MGMRIVLSSTVILAEKEAVHQHLLDMERRNKICLERIYDCARTETMIGGGRMGSDKQDEINKDEIGRAQWFICLATDSTVGENTAKELYLAAELLRDGAPLVITVMHDRSRPVPEVVDGNRVAVSEMMKKVSGILQTPNEQYHRQYTGNADFSNLKEAIEEEFDRLQQAHRFYNHHIGYYARPGGETTAGQIYYDVNRALPENGFRSDFYISRFSVDDQLLEHVKSQVHSFIFLSGRPGSGKTRAVYELLRGELAEKQVVVMRQSNAEDIANALIVSATNESKTTGLDQDFLSTEYYFICDQVADVLQTMEEGLRERFLKTIDEHDNCVLIGTSTPSPLNSLINESRVIEQPRESTNSALIAIRPLSDDSEEILEQLRAQYPGLQGEAIGDFIQELNDYKQEIAGHIIAKIRRDETDEKPVPYLADLLHALQLVCTFRYSTPLFLAVMILWKMRGHERGVFVRECMNAVNYLVDNNVIWIGGMKNGTRLTPRDFDIDLDEDEWQQYDGETFNNIIPIQYTYTINEIVWEVLEDIESKHLYDTEKWTPLFYDMADENGLREAMKVYYKTFPTVSSLRRILPRIPQTQEHLLRTAYDFVYKKVQKIDLTEENRQEMVLLYGMLISRSRSVDSVETILKGIERRGIVLNNILIAEMYSFALRNLSDHPDLFRRFVDEVREQDRSLPADFQPDVFYKAVHEIPIFYDNFGEAFSYSSNLLEQAGWEKVADWMSDDTLERSNLERLLQKLMLLSETMDDTAKIVDLYEKCHAAPSKAVCYLMAGIARHSQKDQDRLLQLFFRDSDAIVRQKALYERLIVAMVRQAGSFADAQRLYERCSTLLGYERPNTKLISLVINQTRDWEFQEAVSFLYHHLEGSPNHILVNKLMRLAPSNDDALFFLSGLRYVQNYAFCNILKKFERIESKDTRFILVCELISHPKLRHLRTDLHVLHYLYKYAGDPWQEAFIDRMLTRQQLRQVLQNKSIASVRINKSYRSFADTYENVFRKALVAQKEICENGKIWPDIYNSMIAKYEKAPYPEKEKNRKTFEALLKDLGNAVENARIIVDEELIFNIYIKTGKLQIFEFDAKLNPEFLEYVYRRKGDADFYHEKIWSKLIRFTANNPDRDPVGREKRCLTLYRFYLSLYLHAKHPRLAPNANLYANLLMAAVSKEFASEADNEIRRFHIEMNALLRMQVKAAEARTGYHFTCSRELRQNIHLIRLKNIQQADDCEKVMRLLQAEQEEYGIVLPSMISAAANQLFSLVWDKRDKKAVAYEKLAVFISDNKLEDSVNARTRIIFAQLAPTRQALASELNRLDQCEDRCDSQLWRLAISPLVWRYDRDRCRGYFRRWLKRYRDIYSTKEAWDNLTGRTDSTEIKKNIRKHLLLDTDFRLFAEQRNPQVTDCLNSNGTDASGFYPLLVLYDQFAGI